MGPVHLGVTTGFVKVRWSVYCILMSEKEVELNKISLKATTGNRLLKFLLLGLSSSL